MGSAHAETRYPIDNIDSQIKTVDLIFNGQLQGCADISLFLVAPDMQIFMIGAAISQFVNQPWITVKIKNDRPVHSKKTVEVTIGEAVLMLGMGFKLENIDHIDEADFKVREIFPEEGSCRQGFHGGYVARAGDHHVRSVSLIATGPRPDTYALGAVSDCIIHRQVLQVRLPVGNNDIDVIGTAETVIGY